MSNKWRVTIGRNTPPRTLEQLAAEHPEACGCGFCHYGLLAWPDPAQLAMPLFMQRAMALRLGRLQVCDCPAGIAQRRLATKTLESLRNICGVEEEKGLLNWTGKIPLDYVPGSWWAAVRSAELVEYESEVPTMHLA